MADPKKALLKRLNSFTSMSSQQNLGEETNSTSKRGKKGTLKGKRGGRYQDGNQPVPFNKNKDRRRSIVDMAPDIPANSSKLTLHSKSASVKPSLGPSKTLRRAIKSGVELTATQKKILALENKVLNNLKTKTVPVSKGRPSKRVRKKVSKVKAKSSFQGSAMIKSQEQKAFIQEILEKTVFFEAISEKNLKKIVDSMYLEEVEENEIIIKEGDTGSRFYVIFEGELSRETNSWDNEFDDVGTLTKGNTFGDSALLYDAPNEFTIVATEHSLVFVLDRKVYRDLIAKMQANDRSQVLVSLRRVPVLHGLTDDTLEELVDFIEEMSFKKGDQVITKGETGTELYVLKSGVVRCTNIGETDGVMNDLFLYENDYFGEAALIKNQPRAADIFCESEVATLYKIDRHIFEKVFGPLKELLEKNWQMRILKTIPIFSEIDDEGILEGLLKISEEEVIGEKGQKIVTKGKKLANFYIILEGKVCIYAHKRMLPKGKRESDVTNSTSESVFGIDGIEQISKEEFDAVAELEEVKTRAHRKKDKIVKEIGQIVDTLKGVSIEDDKGEPLMEFTDENGIAYELVSVVESGNYIGESCLLGELPLADVLTKTAVKLLKFDVAKVNYILSNPTGKKQSETGEVQAVESDSDSNGRGRKKRRHKKKNKSSGSKKYSNLVKAKIEEKFEERRRNTMMAEKANVNFHDLKRFQTLGTGTFGRVRLVQDRESKHFYALKIISKKKVVDFAQKKNVYNEKQAMLESDHPFILKLFATFKDDTNIYMLLELVQGGELFSLMRKLKKRTDAKFYAASILLGLEYLHNKRLIYRDIKPENILLDKQGYVKIVDFGFAKRVKSRTYTMCGTPEYMAPEIFLRKGYNKAVDFWALGICFFEMCFGFTPFADDRGNDHIQVCKNIVRNRLKYPEMNPKVLNRLSKENRVKRERKYLARRRLVKALLRKDPRTRAGMKKHGVEQIKREEVFRTINWEKLEAKKFPAPWRPRIKDEKDCSHFMKYPENERVDEYVDDGTGWDADF